MIRIPAIRYMAGNTQVAPGKKTAPNKAITGSLALQGTKGVNRVVTRRSFSSSMVREAMTPGIEQPEPTIIGMIDLPDKPMRLKYRSMTTAIRAM